MGQKFFNNEFYHIFTRGVDKRKIYLDKSDYLRFIHDLYEFNDTKPALEFSRYYATKKTDEKGKNVGNGIPHIEREAKKDQRNLLVNLHAFVLMSNHHHLLVEQVQEDGITLFTKKLHGGYSRAFNLRHKRVGHLFQGNFKYSHIKGDVYLSFLICYLHANPLDLWNPNWKSKRLDDGEIKQALRFLEKYKWSSHQDYLNIKNFPSVISKEFLLDFFDGVHGYKNFFIDWLKQYKKNEKYLRDYTFEK